MTTLYDFAPRLLKGPMLSLRQFEGEVLLIVNTASACGFTPQYRGLEDLQRALAPRGFSVLAFPCNQFGGQEPGTSDEIAEFCTRDYDISFPVFAKVDVNGSAAHPLFAFLKSQKSGWFGASIKWNFTKFLIDRAGAVVSRFGPTATPHSLRRHIEVLL